MSDGVRCMWMRGGTSKGGYFLKDELPADTAERDAFLLRVMGSPDPRQIDGMGGADPLTSKVAVVAKSERGLDRTRQGESLTFRWPARLGEASLQVRPA